MPLRFEVGQKFPSMTLVDDRGRPASIEEVGKRQPLVVAFYRGPW